MELTSTSQVFVALQRALRDVIQRHGLAGRELSIRCRGLSAWQSIGNPDHNDYPILRGKEGIVEAVFGSARGQAFSDEFEDADYRIEDLLAIDLQSNRHRAHFVAGLNAVFRSQGLAEKTVHCRDNDPVKCAESLNEVFAGDERVLLVGLQPRFLEFLAARNDVRVLDMDPDNIGETKWGVTVEPSENLSPAVRWCDRVLATGSTLVNGTIGELLCIEGPLIFYGVTISAAAKVLGLKTFCALGN